VLRAKLALQRIEFSGNNEERRFPTLPWGDPNDVPRWRRDAVDASREADRLIRHLSDEELSPELKLARAQLWSIMGDWERAYVALDALRNNAPHLDDLPLSLATAQFARGEFKEAVHHYRSALASNPDQVDYRVYLADALRAMGALGAAEDELRTVLTYAPSHVGALVGLGRLLIDLGDEGEEKAYEEATEVLCHAIEYSDWDARSETAKRCASEILGSRRLSQALYAQGYAFAKRSESGTGRALLSSKKRSLLRQANSCFSRAAICDPTNYRARRAQQVVADQLGERRSGGELERRAAWAVVFLAFAAFTSLQIVFFGSVGGAKIDASAYGALTLGLLVLMIAAISLPELLKLKVAGVELEKVSTEIDTSATRIDLDKFVGPSEPRSASVNITHVSDGELERLRHDEPSIRLGSTLIGANVAADPRGAPGDARAAVAARPGAS
jgi:tetratricopeptide (TPR) repeat protein